MPPRRARNSFGYISVRAHPTCNFYAEIRIGDQRIGLGTFDTAHEATRVYDAAAWRLGRPRQSMNFHDVYTAEQAQELAPPPRLITEEERRRHRAQQRRLLIAEEDERARLMWAERFPEDVLAEQAILADAAQRAENRRQSRRERRLDKAQRRGFILAQVENPRFLRRPALERPVVIDAGVILNGGLLRLPLGLQLVGAAGVVVVSERFSIM